MARYTGPACRLCRREGTKLFLKGDRCTSGKCALDRRSTAPGQHGAAAKKQREYGMQLREKQKTKRYYGVLEKQFKNYFVEADRQEGMTGENLLKLIERRLDNVVYRMGMAESRKEARQLVLHEHFELKKVLTCHTFLTVCLYEVVFELLLEDTVVSSGLLLLTKLHSIFSLLLVSCAVLTGSCASAVECALAGSASVALKEELGAFSTAKLT